MFVNRVAELSLLEKNYATNQAELFVLYGRRRVGKTELLAHFCEGKRHVFFVADQVPEPALRANLSAVINNAIFGSGQIGAVYNTWDDLFLTLAHQSQSERLVVVLDEFPYMVASYPPLASILQRLWDQVLKNTRIMLILCGSSIGMMEETVLGYQAPLYGRRTAQYLLEPMEFFDAQFFFDKFKPDDRLRMYAVYGGTPAYLRTIRSGQTLETNILNGILERGSLLYDEVRFILQQELREPRNYYAVLQAIAVGNTRPNEIKQATGMDSITAYLETLQQLHLVERCVPVTETQPHKSRRGIYRLKDNFLRFWFRFVLPSWSQLERGAKSAVMETSIAPELDHFSAPIFEKVCQQYFWRQGLADRLNFVPEKIGSWWQANQEVDLVLLGSGNTMLVECKWASRSVGIDIFQELEGKTAAILHETGKQKITYTICSRSGFTKQLEALAGERKDIQLLNWTGMLSS